MSIKDVDADSDVGIDPPFDMHDAVPGGRGVDKDEF